MGTNQGGGRSKGVMDQGSQLQLTPNMVPQPTWSSTNLLSLSTIFRAPQSNGATARLHPDGVDGDKVSHSYLMIYARMHINSWEPANSLHIQGGPVM